MKTMLTSSTLVYRLVAFIFLASPMIAFSQIGVGTTTPHPSSMLHISAGAGNNKGLIVPKINSASRVALDSTQNLANGLIFFDTDLQQFYYFNSSPRKWFELDHDWIRKDVEGASPVIGTHIYSGVSGNVGIGTASTVNPSAKLTVVGNVTVGSAAFAQDSVAVGTTGMMIVDDWIGINTKTRTSGYELDVNGQAKINSTLKVGGDEFVTGDVTAHAFHGLGIVPSGTVVMWSGTVNTSTNFDLNGRGVVGTEYEGWQMCNGYLTAPDLRGRFIVGMIDAPTQNQQANNSGGYANSEFDNTDYATSGPSNVGGESMHTMTLNELVSHNHGGSTNSTGAHTHVTFRNNTTDNSGAGQVADADIADGTSGQYVESGTNNDGTVECRTESAGNHSHTINSAGSSTPFENRPPYYVLAYIIKL